MKKISLLFISLFFAFFVSAQQWKDNLPQDKLQSGELTFYDIQKAFNDYWEPYNVKNGYYKNENGEEVKALGWKQFRRWEWYWENRIVKETGKFPKTSASEELDKYLSANDGSQSANGNWTSLGPTSTSGGYAGLGRLNCVGFVAGDNATMYVGSPSGGIWKTTNSGSNWTPIGDYNAVLGVSDIAVYRPASSPDVIYIATGDKDGGSMWSLGGGQSNDNNSVGVLKSIDGGTTWNTTGLSFVPSQLRIINRLLMHPTDNNILYAATSVGVYKTINGGTSWSLISATEFIDMEFKPGTPSTLYGSTTSGDIYLSTNDGSSWTATLTTTESRVELAVSANNPAIVYAVISNSGNGLAGIYKSTDSGATFTSVFSGTTTNILNNACNSTAAGGQAWYDLCIAADPTNANNVFVGGVNTWKSTNGGTAWTLSNHWTSSYGCGVPEVHADKHCLAYQNGTSALFECNDGGFYKTLDNGSTWTHLGNGLITSQIYRFGVAQNVSNEDILGLQDNGTKSFLSGAWSDELGGDGFDCAIDYTNQNTLYGELYYGDIRRSTNHGSSWSTISSGLTIGSGNAHWCTPFVIDPNVNTTVYIGLKDVWKSINQGTAWTKISAWAGSTLKSLAVAPSNSLYIYASTSTVLYRTTDGGTNWSNITGTIPVGSGDITSICVKNDDPNTVWVSLGGYNTTRVYQTVNGGTSWTNISTGLPSIPVMSVIQNKQNTSQVELYAGTDVGVYVKVGSSNWAMFSTGLPNVVVTELEIYYNATTSLSRLRAATFGRGLWQSELYSSATVPPVADFVANNTSPGVGSQVNFTDLSSNTPASWSWSFSPSTVTYLNGTTSTSQNPQVQFNAAGLYTVTLTATNAYGSDGETKTNYINVISCTISTLPFTESFSGTTIPTCWTQVDNQGNGQIWQFGTTSGITLNGNYAFLNSDAYGTGNSQNADLITPTLNLSAYSSVTLQFNHYFLSYAGSSGTLSYSLNNGSTWTTIQTYTVTTANPAAFSQVIAAVAGQSLVKFKWNYTGTYGYYWGIDDINITGTAATPPTVTTTAATSITATTASSGGNVTVQGSTAVTARGVCWATTADPVATGNHTTDGSGTGIFTSSVTGLTANTPYHVRAYATNSAGTSYGTDLLFTTAVDFPTVTTTTPTSITPTTASSGGNVTGAGGGTITARGVCWATTANPVATGNHTTDGSGTGIFTSSITGLTANTPYHVRAYATNSAGTSYGADLLFTTAVDLPTVTTTTPTSITPTTASSGGNVTGAGGGTITARGVCWATTANPVATGNHTSDGSGTGIFTSSITGLTANTPYHVRAYATNSAGTSYGADLLFTTAVDFPTVTTTTPTSITPTTASSGGNVTGAGGGTITARGVCWATTANPVATGNHTTDGSGTGVFTSTITGLTANTPYHVRAYATNSAGTSYGADLQFTTAALTLSVTPSNQDVPATTGTTSFALTSNSSWAVSSDQSWCTVTPSGTGSGTVSANYDANVSVSSRVANLTVTVSGLSPITVTVTQAGLPNKVLNLTVFLEGLFNGTTMNKAQDENGNKFAGSVADQITVELHNSSSPYALAGGPYTVNVNTDGTASVTIPGLLSSSYYIVVKHRNSIETWNGVPLSFSGASMSYNFSSSSAQAYGNNLKQVSGKYVIYSGDVNQDGVINASDISLVNAAASTFATGYIPTDLNGDGVVDGTDLILLDNNSALFIVKVTP